MPFTGLPIREIAEANLQDLIARQVPESKTIDYKKELPGNGNGPRKDYLADLSSFANAAGGYVLYGVAATNGVPTNLVGIAGDADKAILRLEEMARDGIRPPIRGMEFRGVTLTGGGAVIVVSVPKSADAPHQVVFQKDHRFYTRGSAGKHRIEVDELRRIIVASEKANKPDQVFDSSSEHQQAIDSLAEDVSWAISDLLNRSPRPSIDPQISAWKKDFNDWCGAVSAKLQNRSFFTKADQLHFDRLGFVTQIRMTEHPKLDWLLSMLQLKLDRLREIIAWSQQRHI